MSFAFKIPEDSPGFLLWNLTIQWQKQQRHALAKLKLTHPQFVVLAGLLWLESTLGSGSTQQQLSELVKMDKMSISDLISTLIEKNMLKRCSHKLDGRAYALSLTAKGKKSVLKAIPIVEGIDKVFFSKDTDNLIKLLKNLNHLILNRESKYVACS